MKQVIFSFLFVVGLIVIGSVTLLPEETSAQADPWDRLRQSSYNKFSMLKPAYKFEKLELLGTVMGKVSNDYVDDTRADPERMLDESLNYTCRVVPEAMFGYEPGDKQIHATVGSVQRDIPVGRLNGVRDLSRVLGDVAAMLEDEASPDTEFPKVEYAMINGILSTLDPHSVFINPEAFEEMTINNEGQFGGLGITIGNREHEGRSRLTILYPLPGTPADRADLRKQDRIIRIGRESTVNMRLEEAVSLLRGEPNTDVTITIERDVAEGVDTFQVTLTRKVIEIESVKGVYLGDGIGGLQIIHFSQDTYDRMDELITKLDREARNDGHERLEGLVIDLRDNPGGYLSQAIEVSDKFLDEGIIVSTSGEGRHRGEFHEANALHTEKDIKLVVVMDFGSASASEIFAGAIQNLDRGVVVGTTSFGKGSVQNLYPFYQDRSALKLTIDKYFTPGGHSIQSVGIYPDIELRPVGIQDRDMYFYWQDAMTRERDLDDHFTGGEEGTTADTVCLYLDPDNDLWAEDDGRRDEYDTDLSRWSEDFQVQFSKTLLLNTDSTDRKQMLAQSGEAIQALIDEEAAQLVAALDEKGVDWRPDQASGTPRAKISLQVGENNGPVAVGETTPVTLTVENVGDAPFVRLRAMADSRLLGGREFVFGRIDPGETKNWTVDMELGLGMASQTDEVTFEFFAEGSRAPGNFVGKVMVEQKPRPRFAYAYQVVDDGSGSSAGNGDGLVQVGEKIDLVVTVKNIGDGPTGDFYISEPVGTKTTVRVIDPGLESSKIEKPKTILDDPAGDGTKEPADEEATADGEAAADEDAGPRQAGFIRLKNKSGADVFLTEGSGEFSLDVGQSTQVRMHFDVVEQPALELLTMELQIGDEDFWEYFIDELTLPVYFAVNDMPPVDSVPAHGKNYKTRGPAAVYSGALDSSPRIATAEGGVKATGKLGTMVRVELPWGTTGWMRAEDLKNAPGSAAADATVEPWVARSPPVVLVSNNVGGTAVEQSQIDLQGSVRDEQWLKDMFVYVNGTKVYYHRVAPDEKTGGEQQQSFDFDLSLDLEEGVNTVEIIARDNEDLLGSMSVGIYRVKGQATAAATTE